MIIYFTGTGNSRFVAEQIAEATGDELVNAVKYTRKNRNAVFSTPGIYVFVSPIYVSAPPMVFLDFIRHSKTRFTADSFIETIDFDYLEFHVIEEDLFY